MQEVEDLRLAVKDLILEQLLFDAEDTEWAVGMTMQRVRSPSNRACVCFPDMRMHNL